MSELKLPVKLDEDFDLIDADGYALLWGSHMIDDNPDIGIEIALRVNNHERLVEALREFSELDKMSMENAVGFIEDNCHDLRALLAALEAEKGGEL